MPKRDKVLIADCEGGEIVRCHLGTVRLLPICRCGQRWARLLNDDLSETQTHVWIAPVTRVLEVVQDARRSGGGKEQVDDVDPLLATEGKQP